MRGYRRVIGAAVAAGTAASVLAVVPAGTAFADKTKTCSSGPTAAGGSGTTHGNNDQWTTTQTQTSACNSNSDTGFSSTTTNGGGHVVK
jgi:hypothetical protein